MRRRILYLIIITLAFLIPSKVGSMEYADFTINIGAPTVGDIVADPGGQYMFISDKDNNEVVVISVSTNDIVKKIWVGSQPVGIDVNSEGDKLYVTNSGGSELAVIDITTLTKIDTISIPYNPWDVVCGKPGRAYVTTTKGWGSVYIVDLDNKTIKSEFMTNSVYQYALLDTSPDKNTLFISETGLSPASCYLYDISTDTATFIAEDEHGAIGSNLRDIEIGSDASGRTRIYLCCGSPYYVQVLSTSTNLASIGQLDTGAYPEYVALSPDNSTVYATHSDNDIQIFDAETFAKKCTFDLPDKAGRLEVSSSGEKLYCFVSPLIYVFYTAPKISGYVLDANSNGITGVTVTLSGDVSKSIVTTSSGYYAFMDLSTGTYTVTPTKTGYSFAPADYSYDPLSCNRLNQNLFGTFYIKGYILDASSNGISGLTVNLSGDVSKSTTTTSSGYYEFVNLVAEGNYTVTPSKAGYSFEPENRSYSPLNSNQDSQNFIGTFTLIAQLSAYPNPFTDLVRITFLLAAEGSGNLEVYNCSGTRVKTIWDNLSLLVGANQVAWDGKDEYGQKVPDEVYYAKLGIVADEQSIMQNIFLLKNVGTAGETLIRWMPSFEEEDYYVDVTNEVNEKIGIITIRNQIPSYSISGYILDTNSAGMSEMTVSLSGEVAKSTTTGTSGYYAFVDLSSGTYTVTPSKAGYSFEPSKRDYSPLNSNQQNQNFIGSLLPVLSVNPASLDFGEVPRGESKNLSFQISNTGGGTLNGTIISDKDWIKVSPTSFESNSQVVNVTVDNSILNKGEGEYTGTVSVTSNGGNKTVDVKLLATCVIVKPHPFRLSSGKPLTFWGSGVVPYDTKINIYTLSGNLVKTIEETEGKNELYWDGTNNWGKQVVPGIYLYTTESPKEKNAGKITVIK